MHADTFMHEVCPSIKGYQWGHIGSRSSIYRYVYDKAHMLSVNQEGHLAELWVGTHSSGPSYVVDEATGASYLLKDLIMSPWNTGDLPYLCKLLSIATPLSIQVHPETTLAQKLHTIDAENYPDDKAKPELVIALSNMTVLHDFRQSEEIVKFNEEIPEFSTLWSGAYVGAQGSEVLSISCGIRNILIASEDARAQCASALITRITSKKRRGEWISHEEVMFHQLFKAYDKYDCGLWFLFVLNIKHLKPLDCLMITPGTVHAYLSGNCLEAMVCSDNVIRAGLTTKFIDVDNFLCAITGSEENRASLILRQENSRKTIFEYIPLPVVSYPHFRVLIIRPICSAVEVLTLISNRKLYVGTLPQEKCIHLSILVHEGMASISYGQCHSVEISQGRCFFARIEQRSKLKIRSLTAICIICICLPNTIQTSYE